MRPLPILTMMTGALLIFSAIKGINPIDEIKAALQGKPLPSKVGAAGSATNPINPQTGKPYTSAELRSGTALGTITSPTQAPYTGPTQVIGGITYSADIPGLIVNP